MASIYDTVLTWNGATTYSKYNIVLGSNSKYYYSIVNSNLNENPITPSNLQVEWDGYILLNGNLIPNFFWKPSYNSKIENKPRIRYNQFGNGYQQRIPDGLNTSLVEFNVGFENRSELETVSILHFLQQRNGQESFIYNIPTIFSKSLNNLNTRFICPDWTSSYVSYNNYNIECKFVEVPE
jgi:phage-related protein